MKYFVLIFIYLNVLFSCKNENNDKESLIEIKRPSNISVYSQWVGGLDGGEWFLLSTVKEKKFRIRNYFADGNKHWDAVFKLKEHGFNPNIPYKFVSISNYTQCTIVQNKKKYTFIFVDDFYPSQQK